MTNAGKKGSAATKSVFKCAMTTSNFFLAGKSVLIYNRCKARRGGDNPTTMAIFVSQNTAPYLLWPFNSSSSFALWRVTAEELTSVVGGREME